MKTEKGKYCQSLPYLALDGINEYGVVISGQIRTADLLIRSHVT
jgi:hypothetical protein